MNIGTEHLILLIILFGTVLSTIGVIYVLRALKFLRFPKFWRTHGAIFLTAIITFWTMVLLYFLKLLRDWGWIFLVYFIITGLLATQITLKLRRKFRG